MKKITFILFFATLFGYSQFTLPIDFEDTTTAVGFQFNNNGGSSNVVNPNSSGVNTSARVLEFNKLDGSAFFAGFGYATNLALADGAVFTIQVLTSRDNVPVRFEIQGGPTGGNAVLSNIDLMVPTANTWTTLTFDFTAFNDANPGNIVGNIVIQPQFVDAGDGTVDIGDTYFFDNITQVVNMIDPMMDASLSDLTIDGNTVDGFLSSVLTYDVELPNGTTNAPTVAGVATEAGNGSSAVSVTQASGVPGTATVDVTAPNGTTMQTYTVNFTEAAGLPPFQPGPVTGTPEISLLADNFFNVPAQIDLFGPTTLTPLDLGGTNTGTVNETFQITGGTGFQYNLFATSAIDASDAAMMRLDVYVNNITDPAILRIFLFDTNTDVNTGGGANIARITLDPSQNGTWVTSTFAIPDGTNRNDFDDVDSRTSSINPAEISLVQIVVDNLGSTLPNEDVFLTNILFFGGTLSTEDFNISDVSVFPNPAIEGIWNIQTVSQNISTVEVYDITGRRVDTLTPNSRSVEINASNLNSGIYFANITVEGSNATQTIKLIKE